MNKFNDGFNWVFKRADNMLTKSKFSRFQYQSGNLAVVTVRLQIVWSNVFLLDETIDQSDSIDDPSHVK